MAGGDDAESERRSQRDAQRDRLDVPRLASRIEHGADATIVRLYGEVDIAVVEELGGVLRSALESAPPPVIIDLEPVKFIDLTVAEMLVEVEEIAATSGSDLQLVGLSRSIRRLMEFVRSHG